GTLQAHDRPHAPRLQSATQFIEINIRTLYVREHPPFFLFDVMLDKLHQFIYLASYGPFRGRSFDDLGDLLFHFGMSLDRLSYQFVIFECRAGLWIEDFLLDLRMDGERRTDLIRKHRPLIRALFHVILTE